METLKTVNHIIGVIFIVCYAYQFLYIPVVWFRRKRPQAEPKANRFAALICARNESAVIGDLISSLRGQTYDAGLISIFVIADNCTDDTALVARAAGARVYERFDSKNIGKGYALAALTEHIRRDYPEGFDGYFVFDADNILSPDYIEQMNRTFSEGYEIVTSYRNSKNYGDNWLSAGSGLWYLRESRYLNHARHLLGTSCAVGGTGFLYSRKVAEEMGVWPFHSLVEDIEFSVHEILNGCRIAFCPDAVFYDEQPTGLAQSFRQRRRWCRGALQVFGRYGGSLIKGALRGSFSCFDIAMATMPAYLLSVAAVLCGVLMAVCGAAAGEGVTAALLSFAETAFNAYLTVFAVGAVTTVTEWRRIRTGDFKKVLYTFTFPLFMFTYVPVAVCAMLRKTEWKPIEHRVSAAALKARGGSEALPF